MRVGGWVGGRKWVGGSGRVEMGGWVGGRVGGWAGGRVARVRVVAAVPVRPTHPTTLWPPPSPPSPCAQVAAKIAEYSTPVVAKAKECVNQAFEGTLAGEQRGGMGGVGWGGAGV